MGPNIRFAGDGALVVELGEGIDRKINAKVQALAFALERQGFEGLLEVVPAYRSLMVYYDPLRTELSTLMERLIALGERLEELPLPKRQVVEIPTVYGGVFGPDLSFVAEYHGLTEDEVIELHTRPLYHVYLLGFTPGFAYLGDLPQELATPRLRTPRSKVPAGSVGIGGNQTGIYPLESPGGWRIIGRTFISLFDPAKEPPTLLLPGDQVKFIRISELDFLKGAASGR